MSLLKLTIDRQNKKLVNAFGGVLVLPSWFLGDTPNIRITVVDPTGDPNSPYEKVTLSGQGVRFTLGSTPTGTAGGPSPLATQTSFTWDSGGEYFTGSLALTQAGLISHVGSAASATVFHEVKLMDGATPDTILQGSGLIKACVDEITAETPAPVENYLTQNESDSRYVKKYGGAGDSIILLSPAGTYTCTLYVDDAGNLHTDVAPA